MRIFLDTNIVMDALEKREPFNEDAERIFIYCENGIVQGYLSANSMTDIYYLLRKHMAMDLVRKHMQGLMALFNILPVGAEECAIALRSHISDFEDAIQAACSDRFCIDYIITRDEEFLQECAIAITPGEFLNLASLES